jgi:hypothetical protein
MKFKLIPNPEKVFFENIEKHSQVLFPLLTIELNDIEPTLNGLIHFILPFEPNDTIGLETNKYHTYNSRCNWLAYRIKNGKCVLEADFNFLQFNYIKSHLDFKDHFCGVDNYLSNLPKDLDEELIKLKSNYLKIKEQYTSYSEVPNKFLKYFDKYPEPFNDIGSSFPSKINSADNIAYPLTEDGRVYKYIGQLDVTDFSFYDDNRKLVSLNADFNIVMYYDPVEQIVLNTFSS